MATNIPSARDLIPGVRLQEEEEKQSGKLPLPRAVDLIPGIGGTPRPQSPPSPPRPGLGALVGPLTRAGEGPTPPTQLKALPGLPRAVQGLPEEAPQETPPTPPPPSTRYKPEDKPFGTIDQVFSRGIEMGLGPRNLLQLLGQQVGGTVGTALRVLGWEGPKSGGVGPLTPLNPFAAVSRALPLAGIPGQVIESALTGGKGFRHALNLAGVPDSDSPLSPAAVASGALAIVFDPATYLTVGTARRAIDSVRKAAGAGVRAGTMTRPEAAYLNKITQEAIEALSPTKRIQTGRNVLPIRYNPEASHIEYITRLRMVRGLPTHTPARDAQGKFLKRVPIAQQVQDIVDEHLKRLGKTLSDIPDTPVEYIQVIDPVTNRATGEVVRRGERGFTELANMGLDQAIQEVMSDPVPFIRRLTSDPLKNQKIIADRHKRIVSILDTGKEVRRGDRKKIRDLTTQYLEAGGDPANLPPMLTRLFNRYRPELIEKARRVAEQNNKQSLEEGIARTILHSQGPNPLTPDVAPRWYADLSKAGKEFWKWSFRQGDSVVASWGPVGKEMVRRSQSFYDDWMTSVGPVLEAIERLGAKVSKEGWDKIRLAREGTRVVLSPEESLLKKAIDTFLDETIVREASKYGLPIDLLPHYWPQRINWKVLEEIGKETPYDKIISRLESLGMTKTQAKEVYEKVILAERQGRPFGNLERPRRGPIIPKEIRKSSKEELIEYIMGSYRRLKEIHHFGMKDEHMIKLINQLPEEHNAFATRWWHFVRGTNPYSDTVLDSLSIKISSLETAAKLPLAVIANLIQPLNTTLIVGARRAVGGLRRAAANWSEARHYATRAGIINDHVLAEIRRSISGTAGTGYAEKVLRTTGFTTVERNNYILAAWIGREYFDDAVRALAKNKRWAYEALSDMGFGADDLQRFIRGAATEADQIKASRWLARETQFLYRPHDYPLLWNHPLGRIATLFKKFSFQQGRLLKRAVWDRGIRRFNPIDPGTYHHLVPLITFLTLFPAMGELIANSRMLIRKSISSPGELYEAFLEEGLVGIGREVLAERPQIKYSQGSLPFLKTAMARYFDSLSWVGGIGLMSDYLRAAAASPGAAYRGVVGFIGGPATADVMDVATRGVGTAKDVVRFLEGEDVSDTNLKLLLGTLVGATPYGTITRNIPVFKTSASVENNLRQRAYEAYESGDLDLFGRLNARLYERFGKGITTKDLKARRTREKTREKGRLERGTGLERIRRLLGE